MNEFVDMHVHSKFSSAYVTSLKELERQRTEMNLRDLLYFANVYANLSTDSMHAAFANGYGKGEDFMDIQTNLFQLIDILKTISIVTEREDPTREQMQNLVHVFSKAQDNLAYVIAVLGGSRPAQENVPKIVEVKQFLEEMKPRVLAWDEKVSKRMGTYTYQTGPNTWVSCRGKKGTSTCYLGSNSSGIYSNSESDEDKESSAQESSEEESTDDEGSTDEDA